MSHYPTDPPRRSVKVAHLVFGVAFVGIAALWALGTRGDVSAGDVPVLVPAVLIGAGVVGLIAAAVAPALRRRHEPTGFEASTASSPQPAPGAEETTGRVPAPATETPAEDETQPIPAAATGTDPDRSPDTDQNDPEDPIEENR